MTHKDGSPPRGGSPSENPKRFSDGYDAPNRLIGVTPHKKRRLKSPKSKGDAFEREVSEYLNSHLGISSHRAALSGGGFSWARGIAPGPDLTGTPLTWIEAKRVEKFNPHSSMAQAVKGATSHHNADMPIVITRRNRQDLADSLVMLRLSDFMKFYTALLKDTGLLPTPALSSDQVITPEPEIKEPATCSSSPSPSSSEPSSTSSPPTQPASRPLYTPPSLNGPIR